MSIQPRFLEAVVRHWGRGANGSRIARPFVVLAARCLGPGPARLRLVKLAHEMGVPGVVTAASFEPPEEGYEQDVQPTKRAA
jgi:hypothetical protein